MASENDSEFKKCISLRSNTRALALASPSAHKSDGFLSLPRTLVSHHSVDACPYNSNLSPLPNTQRCSRWSAVSNPCLSPVQSFATIHLRLPTCQLMGLFKGNHMLPALHTLLLHIGRLSPGVWKPYLHAAVGIILLGGLDDVMKAQPIRKWPRALTGALYYYQITPLHMQVSCNNPR